jgi:hypothetical protein
MQITVGIIDIFPWQSKYRIPPIAAIKLPKRMPLPIDKYLTAKPAAMKPMASLKQK